MTISNYQALAAYGEKAAQSNASRTNKRLARNRMLSLTVMVLTTTYAGYIAHKMYGDNEILKDATSRLVVVKTAKEGLWTGAHPLQVALNHLKAPQQYIEMLLDLLRMEMESIEGINHSRNVAEAVRKLGTEKALDVVAKLFTVIIHDYQAKINNKAVLLIAMGSLLTGLVIIDSIYTRSKVKNMNTELSLLKYASSHRVTAVSQDGASTSQASAPQRRSAPSTSHQVTL
jgi:hypothetical protein